MAKRKVYTQQELEDIIEAGDFSKFVVAFSHGAKPNLRDEDNQMIPFEKALSTKGCGGFIMVCLFAGCDPNYVNPILNKAAIHYAIDSWSTDNLSELVKRPNFQVDVDHMYEGETALSRLIKSLKKENAPSLTDAIRLLLNKGASPNIVDSDGKSLMEQVLLNETISQEIRTSLIVEFLKTPEISLVNYLEGLDYLLMHSLDGNSNLLYYLLVRPLLSKPVWQMLDTLSQYRMNIVNWDNKKMLRRLLIEHITKHTEKALEAVFAILEKNSPKENEYVVELAIEVGSWSTALQLLKSKFLKTVPKSTFLKTTIMQVQLKPLDNYLQSNEYQECLLHLLKDRREFINDFDNELKTPLHYAVLCRNEIAIRVLLKEGARLGVCNDNNRFVIEDMDAKLLEKHFDYCITGRGEKTSHEGYEIIMNFLNMTNENNELDIAPIACMARSKELCTLLEHPLITCFLQLKWSRLTTIFITTHFIINIILSLILWIHICLRFPKRHNNELPIWIVKSLLQVLIGYLLIVEVFCFAIAKHWGRLFHFILIFMLILTNIECGDDIQRLISVFAIMLMGIKLMNLIGALPVPFISVHMLMLRQVASTFATSLLQYSMLLFNFSLCFYVLFSKPSSTNSANSTDSANLTGSANATDNHFSLSFEKLDLSFIKTLVMFNGENDNIDANGYFSIFVVIIFMFMVMVLTNLLGGLAFGDTQTIRAQVELNAAICRANVLYNYEELLDWSSPRMERLIRFFKKLMRIHADTYSYISIFPKQKNRAKVHNQRHRNQSTECIELANEGDNFLGSQVFIDNKDSTSDSESQMYEAEDLKQFNITIENQTVVRAFKIIKEKEKKDLNEQRQEDIRMLLMEIKNQNLMNPVHH